MITLGLDTSEALGGVALVDSGIFAAERTLVEPEQYEERLIDAIAELLEECGRTMAEIELVSVNLGPGSFTGLRIGLATAKGMCQALEIPLAGVDGTEVYRSLVPDEQRVCVVIHTRRDLFYVRWFSGPRPRGPAQIMLQRELEEKLEAEQRALVLIGSGAARLHARWSGHAFLTLGPAIALQPSPLAVARLATRDRSDGVYRLEPAYVESAPVR